ncbi:ATP-binding cassette domain-containing protein [Oscillospiraceae bacterium MB08-C2-2]|nr:ATP-binding cassette domain-containing protein [Oscillospiraceae bacterium MB08-C2-2]
MIETTNLTKSYPQAGVTALRDVSIHIKAGDIFGVIGMSGAGKSTLLRLIGLLEQPTEGTVKILGRDAFSLKGREREELRRQIGTVFQGYNLLMQRTVRKNVAFPLELTHTPRQEITRRTDELLQLVGLWDKAESYPAQLSGGQKQRIAIARALAANPKILLCDEPTSALDSFTTRSILGLLTDINQKLGVTVVIITHEMKVVSAICNRVAVLDQNRLVEEGLAAQVLSDPQTTITKRLLEAM